MRTVLPSNWTAGIAEAVNVGGFATPSIDGWVLVVGRDVAAATLDARRVEAMLTALGAVFGAAQWFVTDDENDRHGWAIAASGELVRGYAFAGEHGHIWWHGDVTDAEHALRCFVDDPRDSSDDEVKWWPERRTVLALARAWSVDPSALPERDLPPSRGWLGRL
jgi:hypothetical protein